MRSHNLSAARRKVDGIILLDKPLGLSSNQALQRVKRLFNASKAGHAGSLDPLATGMLPICLGEATKMANYLLGADKVYRVRLAFGLATTTGDREGVTCRRGAETVEPAGLGAALAGLLGPGRQVPPMHSALKVGGQPLYRLARAGQQVAREARPIVIHELEVESFDRHSPILRVRCSKGTYIRTLVEDIAARAGTVAHVVDLRRLAVAPFPEDQMVSLGEMERVANRAGDGLDGLLVAADRAMVTIPAVQLGAAEATRIRQGQGVDLAGQPEPVGIVRLYGADGQFLGIGERGGDGRILPRRLMQTGPPCADS